MPGFILEFSFKIQVKISFNSSRVFLILLHLLDGFQNYRLFATLIGKFEFSPAFSCSVPGWVLRRPKQFLEELLERLVKLMNGGNNQEMELVTQVTLAVNARSCYLVDIFE